jgi:hypothetical protein
MGWLIRLHLVLSGKASEFPKAAKYSRLKFAFGDGLVTAPLHVWKESRETLNPGFHAEVNNPAISWIVLLTKNENEICVLQALKGFMASFNRRTLSMIQDWTSKIELDKPQIDANIGRTSRSILNVLSILCQVKLFYL